MNTARLLPRRASLWRGVISFLAAILGSLHGAAQAGQPAAAQVRFSGPVGMRIHWQVSPRGAFSRQPLVAPASLSFPQAAVYRLKLTHVPGREDRAFYPTLELAPVSPRSSAFLAHSKIHVRLTKEDFDQADDGRMVTKVLYLPSVRSRTILAILRLGDKDLE